MPDPNLTQIIPIHEPVVIPDRLTITPNWHRYLAGLTLLRALTGTHAQRLTTPASDYNAGTFFFETDRGVLYVVDAAAWKPVKGGTMQAALADAPTDLTANDAGVLLYVTDFAHLVRWTGAAWEFVDGGNGFFQDFAIAPGTGWALCDGSGTTRLSVGATLTAVAFTTPASTTSPNYRKSGAAYTGSILAAIAATISGETGTYTHSLFSQAFDQNGGVTAQALIDFLQHAHVHGAGTLANSADSEPARLVTLPYFRR